MSKFQVSVPGKVILHGEHAVVYGKAAVAVSIDLRTVVTVDPDQSPNKVTLNLKDYKKTIDWKLSEFEPLIGLSFGDDPIPVPSKDVLAVIESTFGISKESKCFGSLITFLFLYCAIAKHTKKPFMSVKLSVTSALPIGAGLGSSAAYSVAIAAALLKVFGAVEGSSETVPNEKDLESISQWAFQSETILHGKPSGIDNSICTHGGALLFRKGKIQEINHKMPIYRVLLVNTHVPRNTKSLVSMVRGRVERQPRVLTSILDACDEISNQCWANLKNSDLDSKQQYAAARELISLNQHLLNSMGVGHPKLDDMASLASSVNLSAKLTGAGGGGCGFVLIGVGDSTDSLECQQINQLKDELNKNGMDCWQLAMGCPGVTFCSE